MSEDECLKIFYVSLELHKENRSLKEKEAVAEAIKRAGRTPAEVKVAISQLFHDHPENLKADSVEALMCLARVVGPPADYALILARMLLMTNHQRNEDIANTLQNLKDPRTVDALYRAALTIHDHLDYDQFFNVARYCTWALADIGTPEAFAKLQLLAKIENHLIAQYATKRIDAWEKEKPRKGKA